jgi:hypothetical protein
MTWRNGASMLCLAVAYAREDAMDIKRDVGSNAKMRSLRPNRVIAMQSR